MVDHFVLSGSGDRKVMAHNVHVSQVATGKCMKNVLHWRCLKFVPHEFFFMRGSNILILNLNCSSLFLSVSQADVHSKHYPWLRPCVIKHHPPPSSISLPSSLLSCCPFSRFCIIFSCLLKHNWADTCSKQIKKYICQGKLTYNMSAVSLLTSRE